MTTPSKPIADEALPPTKTQEYALRAMVANYRDGNLWDHLDARACLAAADEIKALRAALAAAAGQVEQREGWQLVPTRATVEMLFAWAEAAKKSHCLACQENYDAILATAPQPPQAGTFTCIACGVTHRVEHPDTLIGCQCGQIWELHGIVQVLKARKI